jgi:hypothetical protein
VKAAWLLIAIGMVGAVGGCRENTSGAAPGAATADPPVVSIAKPVTQTVTDYLTFTGNTAPINSVTLVARVEGYLEKNHFTDGSWVKKGDLLFTIQQTNTRRSCNRRRPRWHRRRPHCGTPTRSWYGTRRCSKKMPQRRPKWISGGIKKKRPKPGSSMRRPKWNSPSSI